MTDLDEPWNLQHEKLVERMAIASCQVLETSFLQEQVAMIESAVFCQAFLVLIANAESMKGSSSLALHADSFLLVCNGLLVGLPV